MKRKFRRAAPAPWRARPDAALRQPRGRMAPAATVGLMIAACALGIVPGHARGLAESGAFPCSVIETREGYRVPFDALIRVLRRRPLPGAGR